MPIVAGKMKIKKAGYPNFFLWFAWGWPIIFDKYEREAFLEDVPDLLKIYGGFLLWSIFAMAVVTLLEVLADKWKGRNN
jgi:hypothetical protein